MGVMHRDLVFTEYALTDQELIHLLGNSKFQDYKIKPVVHKKHTHNVIIASKLSNHANFLFNYY